MPPIRSSSNPPSTHPTYVHAFISSSPADLGIIHEDTNRQTFDDFSSRSLGAPLTDYDEGIPSQLIVSIDKCDFKQAYKHVQKHPNERMRWYKNREGRRMLPLHLLCERVGIPDPDPYFAGDDKKKIFSFKCAMSGFFGMMKYNLEWEGNSAGGSTAEHDYPSKLFGFLLTKYPHAVELQDDMGQLPIHIACRSRAPLTYVQDLLEIYRDGTTRFDNEGRSPLALTVQFAAPLEIVSCVLKAFPGALHLFDNHGYNPVHMAKIKKYFAAVAILEETLKHPSPSAPPAPQPSSSRKADYQRKMSDDSIVPKPMPRDEKPNYTTKSYLKFPNDDQTPRISNTKEYQSACKGTKKMESPKQSISKNVTPCEACRSREMMTSKHGKPTPGYQNVRKTCNICNHVYHELMSNHDAMIHGAHQSGIIE